ncbi:acetamidase/formamidase family protein [Vibrio astriarenae]
MRKELLVILLAVPLGANCAELDGIKILQPLSDAPIYTDYKGNTGSLYIPSMPETIIWGYLPNRASQPVAEVDSGVTVVFDTVSHEGLMSNQGRDPSHYFGLHGYSPEFVLDDAVAIAQSDIKHDSFKDGPHIVTGPLKVTGALSGDVLKVDVVKLEPRVPYGVISNRHGNGVVISESQKRPIKEGPRAVPLQNVSILSTVFKQDDRYFGRLAPGDRKDTFPLIPYIGIIGVAADTENPIHSAPPPFFGRNLGTKYLVEGSTAYYPVNLDGAMFYIGDGHLMQGTGKNSDKALEASIRATLKLTVLKKGFDAIEGAYRETPQGQTADFWIPVGLDEDLDVAMQNSKQQAKSFLVEHYGFSEEVAPDYVSANTDFIATTAVDKTQGIHMKIQKTQLVDFKNDEQPKTKKVVKKSKLDVMSLGIGL